VLAAADIPQMMRSLLPLLPGKQGGGFRQDFSQSCCMALRKGQAILLSMVGIHPKTVQVLLDHEHITTTLGIYSHVLPSLQKETMEK